MIISSTNTSAGHTSEAAISIGPRKEMTADRTETISKTTNTQEFGGVTDEFVRKNIDRIIKAIQPPETTIDRSIHEVTKQVIYKVMDKASGEVIQQFPEEKLVEAAARLLEVTGMMIDKKV